MTALRPANTSAQQMLRSPATAGYKHLKRGVVAALLACGGLAQAAVVYTFDSANYTSPNGPYTTAMHLQFSFAVANVLASSLTAFNVASLPGFVGMTWSDGVLSPQTSTFLQTLALTTNAGGTILGWDYSFGTNNTFASGNNTSGTGFVQAGQFGVGSGFRLDGTGTWTSVQTQTPVPEPSALALAGIALAGLALSRRKNLTAH